ncbi:MAG: hypothetical protein M1825_001550 [Sarcosagium campestre]|nr:MAG: hypothetical protein M1825_001550 [Sarcosagium campestre]
MVAFKTVKLFGGAIELDIPEQFIDVRYGSGRTKEFIYLSPLNLIAPRNGSNIRQVPDHQEVYLDKDGFTSIIVEVNQRVGPPAASTDIDALKCHLDDITEHAEGLRTWSSSSTIITHLQYGLSLSEVSKSLDQSPAYTILASTERANNADFTGIFLTLVRLEAQTTDLVVTINVPHVKGMYSPDNIDLEAGKLGSLLIAARGYRDKIFESLDIKDWSLFGG